MVDGRFVSYYRVSTDRQGRSGLGLEAQKQAVMAYLNGGAWQLVDEFTEVESGKRDDNRPCLREAFQACRLKGATLIIAKLDRLSRDAHFLLGLQKAGVEFICADMPEANRLTIGVLAVVAEHERKAISDRTKAALAVAKENGTVLGGKRESAPPPPQAMGAAANQDKARAFASDVGPMIRAMRDSGETLQKIAAVLERDGIQTPRGGTWTAMSVHNVLKRLPVTA